MHARRTLHRVNFRLNRSALNRPGLSNTYLGPSCFLSGLIYFDINAYPRLHFGFIQRKNNLEFLRVKRFTPERPIFCED